jgi:hypothetical protein
MEIYEREKKSMIWFVNESWYQEEDQFINLSTKERLFNIYNVILFFFKKIIYFSILGLEIENYEKRKRKKKHMKRFNIRFI